MGYLTWQWVSVIKNVQVRETIEALSFSYKEMAHWFSELIVVFWILFLELNFSPILWKCVPFQLEFFYFGSPLIFRNDLTCGSCYFCLFIYLKDSMDLIVENKINQFHVFYFIFIFFLTLYKRFRGKKIQTEANYGGDLLCRCLIDVFLSLLYGKWDCQVSLYILFFEIAYVVVFYEILTQIRMEHRRVVMLIMSLWSVVQTHHFKSLYLIPHLLRVTLVEKN